MTARGIRNNNPGNITKTKKNGQEKLMEMIQYLKLLLIWFGV